VRFLIFGRGRIAEEKYVPRLQEVLAARHDDLACETVFVDVGRSDSLDVGDWDRSLGAGLGQIDKILILSPPMAHLENVRSVVLAYSLAGLELPEIFIEKPLYLRGERRAWTGLLEEYPALCRKAFYIDHYRYKEPIAALLRDKQKILDRLGPLQAIGWVSLEAQPFWDSRAFAEGYFLEHACHLMTMMGQVFPRMRTEAGPAVPASGRFEVRRLGEWRAWVQIGRPPSCGADSAALLHLCPEEASPVAGAALTAITGKGMADKKFLCLEGERGRCTVWFNEGRIVLRTGDEESARDVPTVDSYLGVAADILAGGEARRHLLSLEQGIAEQEAVIAIRAHLPVDEAGMGRYAVGNIPREIEVELARMGA
jgi:hypothetical protein